MNYALSLALLATWLDEYTRHLAPCPNCGQPFVVPKLTTGHADVDYWRDTHVLLIHPSVYPGLVADAHRFPEWSAVFSRPDYELLLGFEYYRSTLANPLALVPKQALECGL